MISQKKLKLLKIKDNIQLAFLYTVLKGKLWENILLRF